MELNLYQGSTQGYAIELEGKVVHFGSSGVDLWFGYESDNYCYMNMDFERLIL